jgi:holin-like protein
MAALIMKLALITIQIAVFVLISKAGYAFVDALQLPLPGNLAGMLMLFALLTSGVIRLEWVEAGASLLVRHLAFFVIPTAVGLMAFGDLFVSHGVAIIVTLIVSTAIGICVAGLTSQVLTRWRRRDPL